MQRTSALILALLAVAVPATAADAASSATGKRLVIRGAGFGHGVGMSQYGALGLAQRGDDFKAILSHYYTGTALEAYPASTAVRVLLKTGASAKFTGAASLLGDERLHPARTYTVKPSGLSQLAVTDAAGATVATVDPPLRVSGGGTPLTLRGKAQNGVRDGRYRGALEFRATAFGTVLAINALGIEDYVRGVAGSEVPANWPAAALQAQVVAARTYAITTAKSVTNGYDQFADTRSQVYKGIAAEAATVDAAVQATSRRVVTYQGKPATTFYFSTSGGRTENVENSFLGADPAPWLVSVTDPQDTVSPVHRWKPVRMSLTAATRKLKGLVLGTFRGIRVVKRGVSPRIVSAEVVGTGGVTRVTGPQLKQRFGLMDTWATFTVVNAQGKIVKTPGGSGVPAGTTPATPTAPVPTTTAPAATVPSTTVTGPGTTVPSGGADPSIPVPPATTPGGASAP